MWSTHFDHVHYEILRVIWLTKQAFLSDEGFLLIGMKRLAVGQCYSKSILHSFAYDKLEKKSCLSNDIFIIAQIS